MQNNYLDVITTDTFKHDVKTPLYMIHPYHASSATWQLWASVSDVIADIITLCIFYLLLLIK